MLANVFFGCGIVKFSKKKFDELKKMHELPTIRNIRLGDNLPRNLLCVRKSALGVILIEPKIAIDYLKIKLCTGSERLTGELTSVMSVHEETGLIDSRLPKNSRIKEVKIIHWKEIWIE